MLPLFTFFSVVFTAINLGILVTDIRQKKIPNKLLLFLLLLLPFWYWYLREINTIFNVGMFMIQIIGAIIVSFVLYYFGIWSAGDAKYLLVLSMFIPGIGIIPFIGNIGIITLIYLLGYCLYFYGKLIIFPQRAIALFRAIIDENKSYLRLFTHGSDGIQLPKKQFVLKTIKHVLYFLVFFVTLRLSRMDIMEVFQNSIVNIVDLKKYGSYIAFGSGGIIFFLLYAYRRIFSFLRGFFMNIFKRVCIDRLDWKPDKILSPEIFKILNICITLLLLFGVIAWDYSRNGLDVFHKLWLILTTYLALSIVIRMLFYGYRITFQMSEQEMIPIEFLQTGDIIDKPYLIQLFGTQNILGLYEKHGILGEGPMKYLKGIENPIDEETKKTIGRILNETNSFHDNQKTHGYTNIAHIKILKTFAFGGYILAGFIITYFFQDRIISGLLELMRQYLQHVR